MKKIMNLRTLCCANIKGNLNIQFHLLGIDLESFCFCFFERLIFLIPHFPLGDDHILKYEPLCLDRIYKIPFDSIIHFKRRPTAF